jgi:hypothetical protein
MITALSITCLVIMLGLMAKDGLDGWNGKTFGVWTYGIGMVFGFSGIALSLIQIYILAG